MSRLTRADIEQRIVEKAGHIRKNPETGCYDEHDIDEFIALWVELSNYYELVDDRDINVEIVRDYLFWSDRFVEVARSNKGCSETADDAYNDLSGALLAIIKVVEKRIYPFGR